jgi:uncharacterized protein YyaL (SSP411 family)
MNVRARQELRQDRAGGHPLATDPSEHLVAAVEWLTRAHDAAGRGGVARAYSVAWHPYFRRRGWQAAYPETTGYIIPTLFDVAARLNRPDLRERAIRMADWEIEVQLPSGAVQAGVIGEQAVPTPAAFNTGQVLFGLVRAHMETGREEYLVAGRRAADYLVRAQAADGSYAHGRSEMARLDCTTYYTRAAWGLCLFGVYTAEPTYVAAAERNIRFGIDQQLENGWFMGNCLSDPDRPLMHTIAYAIEGILGCGLLLQREEYIEAARKSALAVAACQRPDGGLAGRFARDWTPQVSWDCLTGNAQMSTVWSLLAAETGDRELDTRAQRICRFLMRTQNRTSSDPGLAGGIKGSFPLDGGYGGFEILNWATKFFIDALLLAEPTSGTGLAATIQGSESAHT